MDEQHKDMPSIVTKTYPPETVLFKENDTGNCMFVVRSGRVKIYRKSGDNEMVLAVLGPGEFFGEMALLESLPRSANAQTLEKCELVQVNAQTFGHMIRSNAEIAFRMMRKLASRVRELDLRLQNLVLDNGVGRCIEILRWLSSKGKSEGSFVRLGASVVHIGIAAQARLSPHDAQKVYERLKEVGCIKEDGQDVLIADNATLDAYNRYLDLKRRYDPAQSVPDGAEPVDQEKVSAMHRLLKALRIDMRELEMNSMRMSTQYQTYLDLRQRFENKRGRTR